MPLDEKDQETRRWLEIARRDIEAGQRLFPNADLSSQASFFAQQAAEKAIKGFLVWHQERFGKNHDIRFLGNLALAKDSTLKAVIDEASALSPYAVTFRYPGEEAGPTVEEAGEALAIAQRVFNEVVARLPKDVHP